MDYYVFGYGSLINPSSIKLTLKRKIGREDLQPAEISDYARSWSIVVPVVITENNHQNKKKINAVFLAVQKNLGSTVNGVIFKTSKAEIDALDIREKAYLRTDITNNICKPSTREHSVYFTYVGKPKYFVNLYSNPIILKRYHDVVMQGLDFWGKSFADRFNETTQPANFELIDGSYMFSDATQNMLTGHS